MYEAVSIDDPRICTSKDMRKSHRFAVIGPWPHNPNIGACWPFTTQEEAERAAEQMNAGTWVEPPEEEWKPGEMQKALREISKGK